MKILSKKEDIVKATNGENAVIVVDCTTGYDPILECYKTNNCVKVVESNKFADNGYITPMNSLTMFRDAFGDGKCRICFSREICCLSCRFDSNDILDRAHKANLRTVNAGDSLTIIAKIAMSKDMFGTLIFTTTIKEIDKYRGEIRLEGNDDVDIATIVFKMIDRIA